MQKCGAFPLPYGKSIAAKKKQAGRGRVSPITVPALFPTEISVRKFRLQAGDEGGDGGFKVDAVIAVVGVGHGFGNG